MAPSTESNLALIYKQIPDGLPKPGIDITVEDIGFDKSIDLAPNNIMLEVLYLSLDPYQRNRMREETVKSYSGAFVPGEPMDNLGLARVIKSTSEEFREGDVVKTWLSFVQFAVVALGGDGGGGGLPRSMRPEKIDVKNGPEDLRHWLGALGMPGLTAYSSLYEIGKPKRGETIFVSSAAGAVGQLVGAIAKHEGLKVIGSVGSDEKLKYLIDECGFDEGFNYKKEKPKDALTRLAPDGLDIYYDNVGGEHLAAALDVMKSRGKIIVCGMISQYNVKAGEQYGIKNLIKVIGKSLTLRGFLVGDEDMGPKWAEEHRKKVSEWLKDGSLKARIQESTGMEKGAEGFVGMLQGANFGKAVLKAKA